MKLAALVSVRRRDEAVRIVLRAFRRESSFYITWGARPANWIKKHSHWSTHLEMKVSKQKWMNEVLISLKRDIEVRHIKEPRLDSLRPTWPVHSLVPRWIIYVWTVSCNKLWTRTVFWGAEIEKRKKKKSDRVQGEKKFFSLWRLVNVELIKKRNIDWKKFYALNGFPSQFNWLLDRP